MPRHRESVNGNRRLLQQLSSQSRLALLGRPKTNAHCPVIDITIQKGEKNLQVISISLLKCLEHFKQIDHFEAAEMEGTVRARE